MKKWAPVVSGLLLGFLTMVSAEEARLETPEADCLVWWHLGSPLMAYYCLTVVNASPLSADISARPPI